MKSHQEISALDGGMPVGEPESQDSFGFDLAPWTYLDGTPRGLLVGAPNDNQRFSFSVSISVATDNPKQE